MWGIDGSELSENKQQKVEPKKAWTALERERAPWIKPEVQYGMTVAPPNDQDSNLDLQPEEVLQRRDEPLGTSVAFPLNPGIDRDTGGIAGPSDGSGRGLI